MSVNEDYVKQKFDIIDINGDGKFTLEEYQTTLEANPNFFDWYDLFNNGGTVEKDEDYDHHFHIDPFEDEAEA